MGGGFGDQISTGQGNKPTGGAPGDTPEEQVVLETADSKLLRLFFVGLYMCAVTGMGVTLSIYYLFLWDSRMPELPKLAKRH